MAIKRPDIYENNNPAYSIADGDFVRGGIRTGVADLTALYALDPSPSVPDQFKENASIVYVSGETAYYVLVDITNIGNAAGWEIFNSGSGGSGTLTGATNGLRLVESGTTVVWGGELTSGTTIGGSGLHNVTFNNINNFQITPSGSSTITFGIDETGLLYSFTGGSITYDDTSGLKYGGDYHLNYVDRSLVDKKYVDDRDAAVSGTTLSAAQNYTDVCVSASTITVSNGLTKTGGLIELGGVLTKTTTVGWSGTNCGICLDFSSYGGDDRRLTIGQQQGVSNFTQLYLHDGCTQILTNNAACSSTITYTPNYVTFDGSSTFLGAVYASDYSTNYTSRSLVDKEYVDNAIAISGGSVITGAINGLTISGGNVVLGGTLTGSTTITGSELLGINVNSLHLTGVTTSIGGIPYLKGTITGSGGLLCIDGTSGQICQTSFSSFGGITGATNGLTATGNEVRLGGTLTGETTITGDQNINICSGDGTSDTNMYIYNSSSPGFYLESYDDTNFTDIDLSPTNIYLQVNSNELRIAGEVSEESHLCLVCNPFKIIASSSGLTNGVFYYGGDYSSYYTNRSIPDVAYVTGLTSGGITTVNNGLTKNGTNVRLGGTLTGSTSINATGQDLGIETLNSGLYIDDNQIILWSCNNFLNVSTGNTTYNSDDGAGIQYGDDYSSGYVARSLVDAEYVSGTTYITASNGIVKSSNNFKLGGCLIQNTFISGNSSCLGFGIGSSPINTFTVCAGASGMYSTTTTDINASTSVGVVSAAINLTGAVCVTGALDTSTTARIGGALTLSSVAGSGGLLCIDGTSGQICQTSPSSFGGITGATNGLTDCGSQELGLGGTLSTDVIIDNQDSYSIEINNPYNNNAFTINQQYLNAYYESGNIYNNLNIDYNNFTIDLGDGGNNFYVYNDSKVCATIAETYTSVQNSSGEELKISLHTTNGIVITDESSFGGVKYAADYSSNYTNRSIPDVAYVTGLTSGGITTVNNGLTKNGTNVRLGGALTGNTNLTGAYDLSFSHTNINLTGAVCVTGALDTSTTARIGGALTLSSVAAGSSSTDDVMVITSGGVVRKVSGNTLGENNNNYATTAITSGVTLTSIQYTVLANTTGGTITITLPASPADGQAYKIKDAGGDALSNNINIAGNGKNIDGSSTATINTDYGAIEIVYDSGLDEWYILSFVN